MLRLNASIPYRLCNGGKHVFKDAHMLTNQPKLAVGGLGHRGSCGTLWCNYCCTQFHGRKRSLNPPEQACLRRQHCDSEQDLEIGSEDELEEGLVSHQAAATNINPLQQSPPPPPTSPPITLPTPDASTFQAMMTSMLTSPMFPTKI
ncbi:hypothetical protein Vretimale_13274 [Volvox reticuliferus]|uniref:Uncharacterized protein n=1 Tax=Volvox reticuliferus TaxID=1737510 RepID=A0A8J4GM49_9CHLO|nr:hypothetical protein Vretimale_13274 [Volvox reticuliferus]